MADVPYTEIAPRGLHDLSDWGPAETRALTRLRRILDSLPGGAIGVCGAPGTGKSTLLRSPLHQHDGPVAVVRVELSPERDPLDVVLDIHEAIAADIGSPGHDAGDDQFAQLAGMSTRGQIHEIARLWPLLLLAGVVLIGTSLAEVHVEPRAAWGAALCVGGLLLAGLREGHRLRRFSTRSAWQQPDNALQALAARHLDEIAYERRYDMSFSVGSSAGLKTPVGVEAGSTRSATFTRRRRSLPEIIDAYRSFAALVTSDRPVFILVEGLDRPELAATRVRTLAVLRAIAGVPRSYLLVALPDIPMSQIEEAGMAFDAVVRTDPLNQSEAASILNRRVAGMPPPLIDLCNCLGDGTPRGLLQSARSVFDSVYAAGVTDLGEATTMLVRQRLGESRASALGELSALGSAASSALAAWCLQADLTAISSRDLLEHCRRLDGGIPTPSGTADAVCVASRFAADEYYCATLLDIFGFAFDDRSDVRDAGDTELLERLAASAPLRHVHAALLWHEVSAVRATLKLPVVPPLRAFADA